MWCVSANGHCVMAATFPPHRWLLQTSIRYAPYAPLAGGCYGQVRQDGVCPQGSGGSSHSSGLPARRCPGTATAAPAAGQGQGGVPTPGPTQLLPTRPHATAGAAASLHLCRPCTMHLTPFVSTQAAAAAAASLPLCRPCTIYLTPSCPQATAATSAPSLRLCPVRLRRLRGRCCCQARWPRSVRLCQEQVPVGHRRRRQ